MKKFTTILSLAVAAVAYAGTASAQTATSISTAKPATVSEVKTPATTKEIKVATAPASKQTKASSATATKTAATTETKRETQVNGVKEYERKIEANRNNPNFDLKAAEAELARLKQLESEK